MARKNHDQKAVDAQKAKEAQRIINRVERESEQLGTSSMARSANKVRDHMMGEEAPEDDKVEVMGKRIGRILAVAFIVFLIYTLYTNYIATPV